MNRGAFALFNWTLRNDASTLRTHLMRGLFSGLMCLVLLVAWFQTLSVGAAGLNLFRAICWMNIIVSTLAAISYFSTSVTEESEAGNLGLLKLAGMGAFSILLGKSTSRLIGAVMLLVVQFPFTLLAITLGGVTLIQIVSAYSAIGAHLILVANLAMSLSVYSRTSGRAAAWTAMILLLFFGSVPVLRALTPGLTPQLLSAVDRWAEFHASVSVVECVGTSLEPAFTGPVLTSQIVFSLVGAVALFLISCLGFERATRRHGSPIRGPVARSKSLLRALGVPRAWDRAIAWKEFHYLTGGRVMWCARAAGFGLLLLNLQFFSDSMGGASWRDISQWLALSVLLVGGIESVVYAARILFDETRWHTLSLLLLLPMGTRQLISQKVLGCLLAMLPAGVWLATALWLHPEGPRQLIDHGTFIYAAVNYALLLHFTVLLSLYMRWAAVPAAACVVFGFNSCCPVMSIGLVLGSIAPKGAGLLIVLTTLLIYWILLLVPLQFEIVNRVEDVPNNDG